MASVPREVAIEVAWTTLRTFAKCTPARRLSLRFGPEVRKTLGQCAVRSTIDATLPIPNKDF